MTTGHIPGRRRRSVPRRDDRLACVGLTPRQWEILLLVFAHPLLSRENLGSVLQVHPKSIQPLLAGLRTAGYLMGVDTAVGRRWQVAEAGLRLLARAACCSVQRLVRTPLDPGQPVQQRGLAGLLRHVRHTAGIYGFFAQVYDALADVPGAQVCWWETGAVCEKIFVYQERTYHCRPDALAAVQFGGHQVRFWLEWDRGTMGVRDLERKCATYAAYLSSREWTRGGVPPPALVVVVPEIAQERRFVRVASALLAHLADLRLYTTTASLLATRGILAPIWQHFAFSAPSSSLVAHTTGALSSSALSQRVTLFAQQ